MIAYQWTTIVLGLVLGVLILWLVRRNHLHPRLVPWWVVLAILIALIGAFPGAVDWIALQLGVAYPPALVSVVAIGILLVKMLLMDIARTRNEQRLKILAQKLAVLEHQLAENQTDIENKKVEIASPETKELNP